MNIFLTLTSILIFGFSLLSTQVHAAENTYYVTQNGNSAKSGESLGNAWSVSDFNSSLSWSTTDHPNKIDPGDTVYFSGTITSRITPPAGYGGSSGKYVTLDGWEGGTCDPIAERGCTSASDIVTCNTGGISCAAIHVEDNSYMIIQDFELHDSSSGVLGWGDPDGVENSTHITIRRNYIHDMKANGIQFASMPPNYRTYDYITIGGENGDGNLVFNTLTSPADSHNVGIEGSDAVISYNEIGNDCCTSYGGLSNGIAAHGGDRVLIEYNKVYNPDGQACIVVKEYGGTDRIIRFNDASYCGAQGVGVIGGDNETVYVYGNHIYESAGGIQLYYDYENVHIFANVIHDIEPDAGGDGGIGINPSAGGVNGNTYIYNNTIARCTMGSGEYYTKSGIALTGGSPQRSYIKNNILFDNRIDSDGRQIIIPSGYENRLAALEHNTYYLSSGVPYVYYYAASRTLATLQATYNLEDDVIAGDVSNPGFTDPDGEDNIFGTVDDDYTLNGTNVNDGEDLSQCFNVTIQGNVHSICYNDALDPNITDWSTTPPTVGITKQGDHGSWDRGAYVYKENTQPKDPPPPPHTLRFIN